ncbi:hypothetical protein Tco_0894852 [Tanacetum coccineum]|uniref:Uncharacterized protein n=1 Tax=Tanacetum coccineum TaxID=301880 RepID=A0ABQ5CCZ1_9ASTR
MENKNLVRTLGDYSRPSHEGYRSTIELPDGNNVVPIWRSFDQPSDCKDPSLLREDLTTLSLLKFFSTGKDFKTSNMTSDVPYNIRVNLCSEAWTRFKGLPQKVPHNGIDLWLQVQIFYYHVNPATRRTIVQAARGDFAKPVKAIYLPQDVLSTSDRRHIEHENQVQHLMEAHLALNPPVQVKKSLLHIMDKDQLPPLLVGDILALKKSDPRRRRGPLLDHLETEEILDEKSLRVFGVFHMDD